MFRKKDPEMAARIPPGQHLTRGWPVLAASPIPPFDPATWRFRCTGLCDGADWSWDEFRALPSVTLTNDIHCVTAWSKLGVTFGGVSVDTLLEAAGPLPAATHVMAFSHTGYTTNLPLPT
jgi:DMSO/TMAO reductase YedYZ molybdopterin-dependent catalytic subunit